MKKIAALIAVLLLAAPAFAIELSLEENRGERGSVGYVDMQRLFTNSPDAQHAREGFEDLVRQAEERVNLRKAELLKLHQELDNARVDRDALALSMTLAPIPSTVTATTPPAVSSAPTPAPAPAAVVPAPVVPPAAPAAPASTSTAAARAAVAPPAAAPSAAPAPFVSITALPPGDSSVAASSAAAPAAAAPAPRRELALPGMTTTEAAPTAPPAAPSAAAPASTSTTPAPPAPAAAVPPVPAQVAVSTPAAPAPATAPVVVASTAMAAAAGLFPAPAPAPVAAPAPAGPTPVQRLLELDSKIIALQADIAHKESELEHEHDDADRGLLDVESRKTDQVLARLYRAVSEVARREGVSVVIDKTTILYGHQAVDLTDKVLKYLKETAAPAP